MSLEVWGRGPPEVGWGLLLLPVPLQQRLEAGVVAEGVPARVEFEERTEK